MPDAGWLTRHLSMRARRRRIFTLFIVIAVLFFILTLILLGDSCRRPT